VIQRNGQEHSRSRCGRKVIPCCCGSANGGTICRTIWLSRRLLRLRSRRIVSGAYSIGYITLSHQRDEANSNERVDARGQKNVRRGATGGLCGEPARPARLNVAALRRAVPMRMWGGKGSGLPCDFCRVLVVPRMLNTRWKRSSTERRSCCDFITAAITHGPGAKNHSLPSTGLDVN